MFQQTKKINGGDELFDNENILQECSAYSTKEFPNETVRWKRVLKLVRKAIKTVEKSY